MALPAGIGDRQLTRSQGHVPSLVSMTKVSVHEASLKLKVYGCDDTGTWNIGESCPIVHVPCTPKASTVKSMSNGADAASVQWSNCRARIGYDRMSYDTVRETRKKLKKKTWC